MTSFGPIFLTAVQSVLQLFIMMGVGIYFQRYLHILGFHLRKEMSAIVFSVALPCLLVTKIAYSIDLSDAMVLLVVPLFTVMHLSLSYLFALIGARFLGPCFSPAFHQGHYKATSMLGNAGTVPFMITASVMRMHPWDVERPSSEQEAASVALSIGLVSLYIVLVSPAMWSIGYPMILRWSKVWSSNQSNQDLSIATSPTASMPVEVAAPVSWLDRIKNVLNPPMSATLVGLVLGLAHPLRNIFSNDTGDAFFQNTLWSSMKLCGDLTIPLQLIMLGASVLDTNVSGNSATTAAPVVKPVEKPRVQTLSIAEVYGAEVEPHPVELEMQQDGQVVANPITKKSRLPVLTVQIPQESMPTVVEVSNIAPVSTGSLFQDAKAAMHACPWPIVAVTVLIRHVLLPLCGLLLVHIALSIGLLNPHNRPLLLVLLVESATPPALNLALMCTMSGTGERALASLMIVHHIALLPSLTAWCCVFIWYIGVVSV